MAKELPYFRFYPSEWLEGDITDENEKTQGLFMQICAYYWKKDCKMDLVFVEKRIIRGKALLKRCLDELIKSKILKVDDNKTISITFLDEQYNSLSERHEKYAESGRRGGQASLKRRLSYNIKIDKDKKDGDKSNASHNIFINPFGEEKLDVLWVRFVNMRALSKYGPLNEESARQIIFDLESISHNIKSIAVYLLEKAIKNEHKIVYGLNPEEKSKFKKLIDNKIKNERK